MLTLVVNVLVAIWSATGVAQDPPEFGAPGADGRELPIVRPGDTPRPAPDFELRELAEGKKIRLSDLDAPVIVLHFWSKFRACETNFPTLERLHEKYKDRGVKIIGLAYSSGDREELQAFLDKHGVSVPTLLCTTEVRREYDVATFPMTFLLDGKHHTRYWMFGILVEKHWDQIIGELLDESTKSAQ